MRACMQLQTAKLRASPVALGVPFPEMLQLFRTAAEENRWDDILTGMEEYGL